MAPTLVVLICSVGGSMLFMLLVSGARMLLVYYLSFWFQAAQGQSAIKAGIRTIPLMLYLVIMGIVAAVFTEKIEYYVPAMLVPPCLYAVGSDLLLILTPNAGSSHWISYQLIFGIGICSGFQTSTLAPQTVLPSTDVPLGMVLICFMQQLGGSIFLAVGQNILSSRLIDGLSSIAGLDTEAIVHASATAYRNMVLLEDLNNVIDVYNYALTRTFVAAAALSACTILGAGIVEWKSIKDRRQCPSKMNEANEEGMGEFIEEGECEANEKAEGGGKV